MLPLKTIAAGAMTSLSNLQGQVISEELTIYSSKDVASRMMDSIDDPGFQNCFFATFGTGFPHRLSRVPARQRRVSTLLHQRSARRAPGLAFGMETMTSIDSRTRALSQRMDTSRSIDHFPHGGEPRWGSVETILPGHNLEKAMREAA